MNCCYNCTKRHAHCHVTCMDYKKFSVQNAVERDKRARESRIRQGAYDHLRDTANGMNKRKRKGRKFYGT